MNKIILIGGGTHSKVVIETILDKNEYKIVGILDKKVKIGTKVLDIPIIGEDSEAKNYFEKGVKNCFITIGSIGNPSLRIKMYKNMKFIGFIFPNIISKNSHIADPTLIGEGNFVSSGVIINSDTKIGNNTIINTGSIVEHDCNISDFAHIAPGTILSGNVNVGVNTHVGVGSSVIENITIGDDTIIGAGSVVVKNIENNVLAFGNPCVFKGKNNE